MRVIAVRLVGILAVISAVWHVTVTFTLVPLLTAVAPTHQARETLHAHDVTANRIDALSGPALHEHDCICFELSGQTQDRTLLLI